MPHLRPAFLLDVVFGWVTRDVCTGKLEHMGVPPIVESEDHIQALRHHILTNYLKKANLSEFYTCNIEKYVQSFSEKVRLIHHLHTNKHATRSLICNENFFSIGS